MRISLVHHLLNSIDLAKFKLARSPAHGTNYNLSNFNSLNELIDTLRPTGLFIDEISQLDSLGVSGIIQDSILISIDIVNEIKNATEALLEAIRTTRKALDVLVPCGTTESVYMLLPPTHDVFTLSQNLSDLCKAFEPHVIHSNIGGKISIQSWENGSFWVQIIVGTQAAVVVVAAITSSAVLILKKAQEARILNEIVNGLKIKNDSISDVSLALKEQLKTLTREYAERIAEENLNSRDPEDIKRLELSIKSLSELIEKGTEVHPALMAPEDIRHLFPHQKELPSSHGPLLLQNSSDNKIDLAEE